LLIDNFKESATFSTNIVQYLAKQSNMKICQRSAKPTGEDHYNYLWVLLRIMYNIKLPLLNINNPSTCPLLFSKMYIPQKEDWHVLQTYWDSVHSQKKGDKRS
jgi:hypothetical protein